MKIKLVMLLFMFVLVMGCSNAVDTFILEYQNTFHTLEQTAPTVCTGKGLKYSHIYSDNLQDFNVVCYHDSPYRQMEYKLNGV